LYSDLLAFTVPLNFLFAADILQQRGLDVGGETSRSSIFAGWRACSRLPTGPWLLAAARPQKGKPSGSLALRLFLWAQVLRFQLLRKTPVGGPVITTGFGLTFSRGHGGVVRFARQVFFSPFHALTWLLGGWAGEATPGHGRRIQVIPRSDPVPHVATRRYRTGIFHESVFRNTLHLTVLPLFYPGIGNFSRFFALSLKTRCGQVVL